METENTIRPDERPFLPRSRFGFYFIGLTIVLNLVAMLVAWRDHGWIAVGIAGIWGPALNVCLILVALLVIPDAKQHQGFSLGKHLAISITVPVVAAVLDFLIVFSMDLRGC